MPAKIDQLIRVFGVPKRTFWSLVAITVALCLVSGTLGPVVVNSIARSTSFQVFGNLMTHVTTEEKVIALTFDDGPDENAQDIVDMLEEAQVPATFYVNGANLHKYPQQARLLVTSGHELGNHTYTHRSMLGVTYWTVKSEIERTDSLIRGTGYYGPVTFRPPYGHKGLVLPYYLKMHNRTTVMWSDHPEVFAPGVTQTTAEIVDRAVQEAFPGAVLILHPWFGREYIRAAIPPIIAELKAQGYTFVKVSDLKKYGSVAPSNGFE